MSILSLKTQYVYKIECDIIYRSLRKNRKNFMKKILFILLLVPSLCFATLTWEIVSQGAPGPWDIVYRASIPHGWLVLYKNQESKNMTFVPDEYHEWIIVTNSTK